MLLGFGVILLPFMTIGGNAKRIVEYYCIFLIFAIPGVIYGIKDERIKKIVSFAVALGVMGMFWWSITADGYNIIPYVPIWSK